MQVLLFGVVRWAQKLVNSNLLLKQNLYHYLNFNLYQHGICPVIDKIKYRCVTTRYKRVTHALNMRYTCVTHALHKRYTCVTHVYTCVTHALHTRVHMRYTCVTHTCTHALHMRYTRVTHALHMRYIVVCLSAPYKSMHYMRYTRYKHY